MNVCSCILFTFFSLRICYLNLLFNFNLPSCSKLILKYAYNRNDFQDLNVHLFTFDESTFNG